MAMIGTPEVKGCSRGRAAASLTAIAEGCVRSYECQLGDYARPGRLGRGVVQLARHLDHRPSEPHAREEPLRRLVPLGG